MFTRYLRPTEVPMFSVTKCLRPTRIAAERENGCHAFDKSRRRFLRAVAFAGGRWSSSMVTNLCWCTAVVGPLSILDVSFKFALASYLVSGEPWSTGRLEQTACGSILRLLRSTWSLRWLDVCMTRTSRLRLVKDVVRWLRRWSASRNGQGSGAVPGPSVPRLVRFAPSRRMLFLGVQVRLRMRCRLFEGSVARTSQRCRCNFRTPRNESWRRTVVSRKTSQFQRQSPPCMLFVLQKVVIRWDS